jgi:hypothetical protein
MLGLAAFRRFVERAVNGYQAALEVNVGPAQAEQFAGTQHSRA